MAGRQQLNHEHEKLMKQMTKLKAEKNELETKLEEFITHNARRKSNNIKKGRMKKSKSKTSKIQRSQLNK